MGNLLSRDCIGTAQLGPSNSIFQLLLIALLLRIGIVVGGVLGSSVGVSRRRGRGGFRFLFDEDGESKNENLEGPRRRETFSILPLDPIHGRDLSSGFPIVPFPPTRVSKDPLQSELIGVRLSEEVRVQRFVHERERRIFRYPDRGGRDELWPRDGFGHCAEDVQDRFCGDVRWVDCEPFCELERGHVGRSSWGRARSQKNLSLWYLKAAYR